jgi:DNA-binding transcriptional LysR family regulator
MKITHGLAALKARGPEVHIDLRMQPSDDIEIGVLDGRLNVGVIPQVRDLPGLTYTPLYEESASLYCADNHPLFADPAPDVAGHEVVQPRFAQPAEATALYARHRSGAQANDREGILFLVLTGCYLGYLPDHYAAPWIRAGRLRALAAGFTTRFCAITARSRRPGLVLETFLETLETGEG